MSVGQSIGAPASAKTQRAQILRLLIEARGSWVPSPRIAALAQQYNARLFELRRAGFCVENRIEADEATGERRSWFRLVRQSPTMPAAASSDWYEKEHGPRPKPKTSAIDLPLFAGVQQ